MAIARLCDLGWAMKKHDVNIKRKFVSLVPNNLSPMVPYILWLLIEVCKAEF